MAKRKTLTPAAINRQIDAINRGRGTNPTASKSAKIKADVRRFAKEHGIAISPNAGESPLMGKGDWFKVFDSWLQAHDYFTGWKWKHVDHGLPFPWDDRKSNPARTATLVARKPAAKNPARKTDKRLRVNRTVRSEQWLKFHVQEKRGESDKWTHTAGFHLQSDAERYAKSLHAIRPDMFFRVVSAS